MNSRSIVKQAFLGTILVLPFLLLVIGMCATTVVSQLAFSATLSVQSTTAFRLVQTLTPLDFSSRLLLRFYSYNQDASLLSSLSTSQQLVKVVLTYISLSLSLGLFFGVAARLLAAAVGKHVLILLQTHIFSPHLVREQDSNWKRDLVLEAGFLCAVLLPLFFTFLLIYETLNLSEWISAISVLGWWSATFCATPAFVRELYVRLAASPIYTKADAECSICGYQHKPPYTLATICSECGAKHSSRSHTSLRVLQVSACVVSLTSFAALGWSFHHRWQPAITINFPFGAQIALEDRQRNERYLVRVVPVLTAKQGAITSTNLFGEHGRYLVGQTCLGIDLPSSVRVATSSSSRVQLHRQYIDRAEWLVYGPTNMQNLVVDALDDETRFVAVSFAPLERPLQWIGVEVKQSGASMTVYPPLRIARIQPPSNALQDALSNADDISASAVIPFLLGGN